MSALMSIGKTAMFASYAALQTTGNNIANANTPGYSRQQVQLADAPGQYTGAGFFGKGVAVTTVTRAYDRFLTNQAVDTSAIAAADAARAAKLTQLEGVFPIGEAGLGYAAGELVNAFVDVANTPGDASAREVVLGQARELASRFRAAGEQLGALQGGVTADVRAAVGGVNALAQQVAEMNRRIAALRGTAQPPNQLLDERDRLIADIAATIHVTTVQADDGSVGVFIGGGQSLVLGSNASTLKAVPDAFDPAQVALALTESGTDRLLPPSSLAGGSLTGLLRFQNNDLAAATNLLGQMAAALAGAMNRQQSLGLDLGRPAGAGAPMFAAGAPRVLPASGNAGSATLSLVVTDASQLQATDFALEFDGSAYTLTRRADGAAVPGSPFTPAALAAGVTIDGATLALAAGGAAAGDRFLLQPVAAAARNLQAVLGNGQAIAAAAPFTASLGVGNAGSATAASLEMVDTGYDPGLGAVITFTSDAGDFDWATSDGATGSGSWRAGAPIALNGFELTLAGVPRRGDTASVQPTRTPATNNGNALAFARLGSAAVVASAGPGGAPGAGQSITDAYSSAIAQLGVRVQGGKAAAGLSGVIASHAETARANAAGVNLDEEAARLIQFQQSYQAAAKILQVAQSLFDTLLQATR